MAAIWFHAPLTCLNCGTSVSERETDLHTPHLGSDATDTHVYQGEVVELSIHDFIDAYFTVSHPGDDPAIRTLEQWSCPACKLAQWARLDFHREDPTHHRFVSAHAVPLTPEIVRGMHFVSRWLDLWIEANPEAAWITEFVGELRQ